MMQRCAYLQLPNGLICIGRASIGRGPATILFASHENWRRLHSRLGVGVRLRVQARALLTDRIEIELPDRVSSLDTLSPQLLAISAQQLHLRLRILQSRAPSDSLVAYALPGISPPSKLPAKDATLQRALRQYLRTALTSLFGALYGAFEKNCSEAALAELETAMVSCLGAGQGLTPAGDDCLAGVFIALHLSALHVPAAHLRRNLLPHQTTKTNIISAQLLQDAAVGRVNQMMLDLLTQLCSAAKFDAHAAVQRLNSIGHTSGWDTLAGLMLVVDAWLGSCAARSVNSLSQ